MLNFLDAYGDLTVSEKKCLKYIVDNAEEIPNIKIKELSEKAFISKTVIINLSQKLGFSGFKELKYYVNNQLNFKKQEVQHQGLTVKRNLEENIEKSLSLIVEKDIDYSAKMLLEAKNIFIMARGTSKAVGYYLEHLLFSLGIHCFFIHDYNLSQSFARLVDKDDAVILISLSGNTERIVETAKSVHFNNAKIISMTGFQSNLLSSYADYSLYCHTESVDTKKDDSVSRIGFFILIDILVNTIKSCSEVEK